MVQHAARAEVPPREGGTSAEGPEELGRDWLIYRECRLRPSDRGSSPTVLIHPARGVAVLDIPPSETPDAVDALLARLAAARFPAIFAGYLPVVHLRVAPRQMPFLPSLLADAFAAQPPLRLPGGDAWVGVAARALTAEQPTPRIEPQRFRSAADGRARRLRAGAVLRKAGAVLLCLAALGGVLGLVLRGAPVPESTLAPVAAPAPAGDEGARGAALPTAPPETIPAAPPPPRSEAAATVPTPDRLPPPAVPRPPAEIPPPPPPPERAASPPPAPRSPEAGSPPGRRSPERTAPRRQREAAGPPPSAGAAAPSSPEAAAERCRRVSALVGSGAPLGEADMRFFNEACIRW